MRVRLILLAVAGFASFAMAGTLVASASEATLPDGPKHITLVGASGERLTVGTVTFVRRGDAATFEIALDSKSFQDEFLSMRPFSCIPGGKEMWCHLAYPYDLKRRITAQDLADLEYSLLFLFKPPGGYGIDPWNGLYFDMALDGGGGVSGTLHDVNLDPLGTPPADRTARIISDGDLTKSDPASRRFSTIEIR